MKRSIRSLSTTLVLVVAISPARADEPPPAEPPPETPADPAEPLPAPEPSPAEAPPAAPAPAPAPVIAPTAPTHSELDASVTETSVAPTPRRSPRFALEVSGLNARNANPYVQHQGWNLETGDARGVRVEAQWIGISLGVETVAMTNERACGIGCFEGDFGRTSLTAVDLGFRFRFSVGPVRPFLAGSIGGVRASSGDWTMTSDRAVYGGIARAAVGVEVPFARRLFASGQLGYRFVVTENPLRDPDQEALGTALLGVDTSDGSYAEDAHQIGISVGIGVEL